MMDDDDLLYLNERLAFVSEQRLLTAELLNDPYGIEIHDTVSHANDYYIDLYSNVDGHKYTHFKTHLSHLIRTVESSFYPGDHAFMVYDIHIAFDDGAIVQGDFDLSYPKDALKTDPDARFALFQCFAKHPYVTLKWMLVSRAVYPIEDVHLQLTDPHNVVFYIEWKFDLRGNLIAIKPITYHGVTVQSKAVGQRYTISAQSLQTFKPEHSPSTRHSLLELFTFLSAGPGRIIYSQIVSMLKAVHDSAW